MSRDQDLHPDRNKHDSKQSRCSLVDGAKRIEISAAEFEAARKDRDELWRQLEIECWFAELRSAVLAWQEKMLRFAARMHSEETHRFVPIQVECELTSRMAAVVVATHGLRPALDFENTFNPYSKRCAVYDLDDAPRRRAHALQAMLDAATRVEVDSIWIGRDLGYRGGRRTGLALTDDVHISTHAKRWGVTVERPTKGEALAERTAAVIWSVLSRVEASIFLWNVFPLHPHDGAKNAPAVLMQITDAFEAMCVGDVYVSLCKRGAYAPFSAQRRSRALF